MMTSLSRLILWFTMLSLEWKKLSSQEDNTITGPGFRIQPPFYIRYPKRRDHVRRQKPYPASFPFPCANATWMGRSRTVPTSAHRLRPADVDVVGAMGDSLVAGNGALEEWALGALIEYRGVSWCAGGEGTWREFLTLPNILKELNPDLTGYSIGTGEYLASNSGMNVGFPVSSDEDALQQAKVLVARMRADPRVDIARHWKLITVFFGANDLCSAYCFSGHEGGGWTPRQHARKLARALDYLQAHLPRTFVNLIPVLDVSVSVRVRRSPMCRLMHTLFCSCFHQGGNELETLIAAARLYQQAEEDLISSGRYDQREDFTVVMQPFMKLFNAPGPPLPHPLPDVIDVSYVTHDCFHFSQKGHALAANMLWNNMLQPVGSKSTKKMDYVLQKFLCPSERAPFFFTSKNSKTFYQTGYQ